jgi:hypothetical protein
MLRSTADSGGLPERAHADGWIPGLRALCAGSDTRRRSVRLEGQPLLPVLDRLLQEEGEARRSPAVALSFENVVALGLVEGQPVDRSGRAQGSPSGGDAGLRRQG